MMVTLFVIIFRNLSRNVLNLFQLSQNKNSKKGAVKYPHDYATLHP